ncbi:MAG: hypothetical protein J7J54_04165, partial [Candidatus Omnitrophica bacterium]|nr:hypothetical protein [Candidatus Omnitrophota bacterium]
MTEVRSYKIILTREGRYERRQKEGKEGYGKKSDEQCLISYLKYSVSNGRTFAERVKRVFGKHLYGKPGGVKLTEFYIPLNTKVFLHSFQKTVVAVSLSGEREKVRPA